MTIVMTRVLSIQNSIGSSIRQSQWPLCLWQLACWDWGFESRRGHRHLSLLCVVCCQVEGSVSEWSLVHLSPNECGVSECDHEASIMRKSWPSRGSCAKKKIGSIILGYYFDWWITFWSFSVLSSSSSSSSSSSGSRTTYSWNHFLIN